MLLDKHTLSLFRLAPILDDVSWIKPDLIIVRVSDAAKQPYSERLVADEHGKFIRLQRIYDATQVRIGRVVLSSDKDLAGVWQQAPDARTGWEQLRKLTRRTDAEWVQLRDRLSEERRQGRELGSSNVTLLAGDELNASELLVNRRADVAALWQQALTNR